MIKAALYIRVSTEEQYLHGLSLDAQKSALLEYADKHNMQVIDVYADEGITARKRLDKRLEFQRLIKDVRQGKIDLILVTKLDRWFRNIRDYHNTQDILEKYNCNWRTIFENYDTSTAAGRLHINIMLSVNQDECDRTSERIKAVFKHKIDKNEVVSGSIPRGYKIENKKLVKDHSQENLIHDIFDYFELHNNKCGTVSYINDKYGLNLHYNTVCNILSNEIYKGSYKGNTGFCEPYINASRFDKIQGLMKRNVKNRYNDRVYPYSGLLICTECGCKMAGTTQRNKSKVNPTVIFEHKIYRCNQYYTRKLCSHNKILREDKVDKYVADNLERELQDYIATFDIKEKTVDYSKQRNAIEKKIKRLKDLYINELIDLEEYKADLDKYKAQLEDIPQDSLQSNLSHLKELLNKNIGELYLNLTDAEKQAVIRSVVKCIHVSPNNTMQIEFL